MPLHTGELYLFSAGTRAGNGTILGAAPGIEANYSFLRNSFVHLIVPATYSDPHNGNSAYGLGDIELGFKWRFVQQTDRIPDIATFPLAELPSGSAKQGLGNGAAQYFLPVWLQKDWGSWTVYGGGGYWINDTPDSRNWWFSGMVLQRQIDDRLYLGGEIFRQTANSPGGRSSTGFDLGGGYAFHPPYQILASMGRNVQSREDNQLSYYIALYRTF